MKGTGPRRRSTAYHESFAHGVYSYEDRITNRVVIGDNRGWQSRDWRKGYHAGRKQRSA